MGRVVVVNHVTLDGVMQAPGRPDEHRRVSRTLEEPPPWINSTLLSREAAETVAGLKRQTDSRLTIFGSGELIRSLMPDGLIDEWMLMIHPLVLGSGRRLFAPGASAALRLTSSLTTTTGVIISTYQPAEGGSGSHA